MKKRIQPTRRQFLAMMGSASLPVISHPLSILVAGLADSIIMRSQAKAADILQPRKYVFLNLAGGPPRWLWDMPLAPYSNEQIVRNATVNTRFTSSTAAAYVATPISRAGATLNLPHLWSTNIPTANGGQVGMATLLDNMVMIRGVRLPSDGHENNNFKILRPVNSEPSLTGAVADRSQVPLPAVALPGAFKDSFKSRKGLAQSSISNYGGDPLGNLLSPFIQAGDGLSSSFQSQEMALDSVMNSVFSILSAEAKTRMPGSENLFSMRSDAERLVRQGVGNLQASYASLLAKYNQLISACASSVIPGVTDVRVAVGSLGRTNGVINATVADNGATYLGPNADTRAMIHAQTKINGLAEGFAVAEYLLLNNYSTSVNMGVGSVNNLGLQDRYNADGSYNGTTTTGEWAFDEHRGGSFCSLIINSFLFKCISACTYELINALKSANMFDESVIQIGGEFSRSARNDESGSDHGWVAYTTSLFSGAIKKPMVLGNCNLDGYPGLYNGNYGGSWGTAAPVKVDGVEQELTLGHATSTVASLLRVSPPMPNNSSLVSEDSTGTAPTIELARNKG